ncbi:MAG: AraC family transcriptional regulator [Polyangiales bacterium]
MQVSVWLVRAVVSAVERAGAQREQFFRSARLDRELIEQGQARLYVDDYLRAIDAAIEVTRDAALGLHMGEQNTPAFYHVVAHLVEHAATLGEAIATITRYSELLASGYAPQLIEEGELAGLRFGYLSGEHAAIRFTAEFALSGLMRLLRMFHGEQARPEQVSFAYQAPSHRAEYRRVFGGLERFDQAHTELWFPRSWLANTSLAANAGLFRVLQTQADRELALLERGSAMVERVERLLAARDPRELPTMNDCARELGISARTLARKLRAEAATYQALTESRRTLAAKSLLEGQRLTIQEIADVMGFADASAFHRAFRRWTGTTPKQYVSSVLR